jgi:hypothetical protein
MKYLSLNPSCSLPKSFKETASPINRFDSFSSANRKFKCRRCLNRRTISKMDVPSDSFGGLSPERYASVRLPTTTLEPQNQRSPPSLPPPTHPQVEHDDYISYICCLSYSHVSNGRQTMPWRTRSL